MSRSVDARHHPAVHRCCPSITRSSRTVMNSFVKSNAPGPLELLFCSELFVVALPVDVPIFPTSVNVNDTFRHRFSQP